MDQENKIDQLERENRAFMSEIDYLKYFCFEVTLALFLLLNILKILYFFKELFKKSLICTKKS